MNPHGSACRAAAGPDPGRQESWSRSCLAAPPGTLALTELSGLDAAYVMCCWKEFPWGIFAVSFLNCCFHNKLSCENSPLRDGCVCTPHLCQHRYNN